jgi:hypothetical protein
MGHDARAAMKDQLRRELFKSDRNLYKDDLVTTHQRERFVQEQADALSSLVGFYYTLSRMLLINFKTTQLNVRADLITFGVLVLPGTSSADAVSTCFSSSAAGVDAWKHHQTEISNIVKSIARRAE